LHTSDITDATIQNTTTAVATTHKPPTIFSDIIPPIPILTKIKGKSISALPFPP